MTKTATAEKKPKVVRKSRAAVVAVAAAPVASKGAFASLETYNQTPRKVRLVTDLVKGKTVTSALAALEFLPKRAAEPIAKLIKSAVATAKNVVKKLEKTGIIQSYTILPDHVMLGKPRHRVLFKLSNLTSEKEKKLFAYCRMHPNIVHHLRVIGNWDLVLDVEVERGEPFRKIIQEMKYRFSDIIQRVEPTYIYKIDQFRDIPVEYPELNSD